MKSSTLLLTLIFILSFSKVNAQDERTKIYFLADTIDVPKNQRILEISRGPLWFVGAYEFYMKLHPNDNINLIYIYEEPHPEMQAKILDTLPKHHYRSWKSLFFCTTENANGILTSQKYYTSAITPEIIQKEMTKKETKSLGKR